MQCGQKCAFSISWGGSGLDRGRAAACSSRPRMRPDSLLTLSDRRRHGNRSRSAEVPKKGAHVGDIAPHCLPPMLVSVLLPTAGPLTRSCCFFLGDAAKFWNHFFPFGGTDVAKNQQINRRKMLISVGGSQSSLRGANFTQLTGPLESIPP